MKLGGLGKTDLGNTPSSARLIAKLKDIVGARQLLTDPLSTHRYRTGFRYGSGPVAAVVRPGSLLELWQVLAACVSANAIVIMQAANTGLTGGSTPHGENYDRSVVLVSTLRLATVHLIDNARQVICLPGATLYQLEKALRPFGRAPHSVIGSSCIGASVIGGVCNNSGGSLIQRGPAYTQLALFAQVEASGALRLVNHLGVELGGEPYTILARLERGDFGAADIAHLPGQMAADHTYAAHVRDVDADTPARFNADPARLYEAAGSAGKIAVFAVRLDTFPMDKETAVFYVGSNDAAELAALRRHMLSCFAALPVAAEYLHREAFDIAAQYGKDMFLAIRYLGTDRLPALFAFKAWFDTMIARLGLPARNLSDRLLHALGKLFPEQLPPRIRAYRQQFEHHLMLRMAGTGIAEAREYFARIFPSGTGACFECSPDEGDRAFLHRFAAAGAAIRYRDIHHEQVEDIVALDFALKRNEHDWSESLPADLAAQMIHKLYYGHFFCHVFHHDYIIAKRNDVDALELRLLARLDACGAEYPAEHNVGHKYEAKPALSKHYRELDPRNTFNPGIGCTSRRSGWL